jgi:hypothetical protein
MMGQVVTTFGRARVVCELVRRFRCGAIHLSYLVHPAHATMAGACRCLRALILDFGH